MFVNEWESSSPQKVLLKTPLWPCTAQKSGPTRFRLAQTQLNSCHVEILNRFVLERRAHHSAIPRHDLWSKKSEMKKLRNIRRRAEVEGQKWARGIIINTLSFMVKLTLCIIFLFLSRFSPSLASAFSAKGPDEYLWKHGKGFAKQFTGRFGWFLAFTFGSLSSH